MTALRVCFVGDSVLLGTGDDDVLGWPGRVGRREREAGHALDTYNLGIRADTSELIAARWRPECEARLPDAQPGALVFSFGLNDMAELDGALRVPVDESLVTARDMLSVAKAWKPTLWVGPTPVDDSQQPFHSGPGLEYHFNSGRIAALSDAYADLARDLDIPYLDLFTQLAADDDWPRMFRQGDGVHPVAAGYAMMAERIAGWEAWRRWFDGG